MCSKISSGRESSDAGLDDDEGVDVRSIVVVFVTIVAAEEEEDEEGLVDMMVG